MGCTAIVVLSGGQDSTTCLYWALRQFGGCDAVQALTFDYGQRHRMEIEAARTIARLAGVAHMVLPLTAFAALGGNALTGQGEVEGCGDGVPEGLPATFVPGRNLVFLTLAAARAYQLGVHDLVTGVSQTDYSGYPDCRRKTIDSLEQTLCLGMEYPLTIHTPLMHMSKAETVLLARELGGFAPLAWTHTCYNGVFPPCGDCAACRLRAAGFEQSGYRDPLLQRAQEGGGEGG